MKNLKIFTLILLISMSGTTLAAESSFSVKAWAEDLKKSAAINPSGWSALQDKILKENKSKDIEVMKKARKLFEAEKFAPSKEAYEQVPRGNDHWLEAVEEIGWIFHRQQNYHKALAQTKTLLSQAFSPVVGAEPFFLQSLSQLKICDYKGVLETHELFKKTQRQRLLDLRELEKTGRSPAVDALISKVDRFPLSFPQVGEESKSLPRLFYRDVKIQKALMTIKMAEAALSRSTGNSSDLMILSKKAAQQLQARMKTLAEIENEENFKIVQKLNLIEVETIQRIHADQQLDKDSYQRGQFAKVNEDQMIFPDDDHPWLDELDKFEVRVNSCPQNIRRKM
ncbi:MAG: hypothetical protein ACAH59_11545 [Pseudobdellovibrionaceae bacterium]